MPRIDRHCAFRPQILLPDPRQNFLVQWRQAFFGYAGNSQRREIFPVTVLGQIAFIQNDNFVRVVGPAVATRPGRRYRVIGWAHRRG